MTVLKCEYCGITNERNHGTCDYCGAPLIPIEYLATDERIVQQEVTSASAMITVHDPPYTTSASFPEITLPHSPPPAPPPKRTEKK